MKISGEDAFQALLEGRVRRAPARLKALGALASALGPEERQGPDPRFQRRLRSELLAAASLTSEDLFAAAVEGETADERVRPLVAVAAALSTDPGTSEVDPRFRFTLRNRLIDLATDGQAGAKATLRPKVQRARRSGFRIAVGMGAAATMLFGSTLAAAQEALPGDLTYPVKLAQERVALWPVSGSNEGLRKLDYSRRRLGEVRGLTERSERRRPLYTTTLNRMDALLIDGADLILEDFTADRANTRAAVERLSSFAIAQASDLASLMDRLPPEVRPAARDSLGLVESTSARATAALEGCGACPTDAVAPSLDGTTPSDGTDAGAPCQACGSAGETTDDEVTDTPNDSQNSGGGSTGGGGAPQPGTDGPGATTDDGPFIDLPPVDGTTADEQVEEEIDKLLEDLGIDPRLTTQPTPSASVPALPPVVTVPTAPAVTAPTQAPVRLGGLG